MKSVIVLPVLGLVMMFVTTLNAQDCDPYFIIEKGAVREMKSYDKKDKLTGTTIQTVLDVKEAGNATEWTVEVISTDAKGENEQKGQLVIKCEEGIFKMDMNNFVSPEAIPEMEGMEVTVDGTQLDYPKNPQPGQTLPDGNISIAMSSSGVQMMTMTVRIFDRKIEAIEDVTTPAGTFNCYKMTYSIETKTMFKVVVTATEWFAKNVGTVRNETYDKSGKLESYMVLTSLK